MGGGGGGGARRGPGGAGLGGREARLGWETAVQVGELSGPDKEAAVTGCVGVHLCVWASVTHVAQQFFRAFQTLKSETHSPFF